MKIRTVTLAMMALMLSAGPLMAMDSVYQEERRQALYEQIGDPGMQPEHNVGSDQDRHASQPAAGPRQLLDERWQVIPDPWWH